MLEYGMPLQIPDEILRQAGLTEREALVEFACRLFDAEKLTLWQAAQMAGLSRVQLEKELRQRGIAIYRPTLEDFAQDLKALKRLGA